MDFLDLIAGDTPEVQAYNTAQAYKKIRDQLGISQRNKNLQHRLEQADRGIDPQEMTDLQQDPMERWRQEVQAMIQSGDPTLQQAGLNHIAQYRQMSGQRTDDTTDIKNYNFAVKNGYKGSFPEWLEEKRVQRTNTDDILEFEYARDNNGYQGTLEDWIKSRTSGRNQGPQLTWEQYQSLPPDQQDLYDRYNRFQRPASIQKYEILRNSETPEEFASNVNMLGLDSWKDLGDEFYNAFLANQPEHVQQRIKKNIESLRAREQIGKAEGDFIAAFPKDMGRKDAMYTNLDYSIEVLNELYGLTDYSTTGFASWLKDVPATSAGEWQAMRDVFVSRIGLDKLMELKEGSATGSSGLGALSEKELSVLQSYVGALNQASTPPAIRKHMRMIYGQLRKVQNSLRQDQRKQAARYQSISSKFIEPHERLNVDEYLNWEEPGAVPLSERQSEATKNTPSLPHEPFTWKEVIPKAFQGRAPQGGLTVGQVKDGYRYLGGNPKDPKSWQEVAPE